MPGRQGSVKFAETVLSGGSGGVQELQQQIDEGNVAWALLRFQVGSGAFARTKFVAVHINGEMVPSVRRGQMNAHTARIFAQFGQVHASIEVKLQEELTLDLLCNRL